MKNNEAPGVANAHEKGQMQGVAAVAGGSAGFWAVSHEDHDTGLHGPHPKFATEVEAQSACDRWNRDIPGHSIYYVPPAPPEFTSLPNEKAETRAP